MAISQETIFQKAEQKAVSGVEPMLNEGRDAVEEEITVSDVVRTPEIEIDWLKDQLIAALARGDELSRSESMPRGEAENLRRDVESLRVRLKEAHAEARSNQENYLVASFFSNVATVQAEKQRLEIRSLEERFAHAEEDLKKANFTLVQLHFERMFTQVITKRQESLIDYLRSEVEALRELIGSRG